MLALRLKMPQNPLVKAETIHDIIGMYGAVNFIDVLSDFIARVLNDLLPGCVTWYRGENIYISFSQVPVYHSMKFTKGTNPEETEIVDSIYAQPEQRDSCRRFIPS